MTLKDLLAAQPDLMAEHRSMVLAEAAKANAPVPATVAQLKEAFPGAENAEFRETCLEKSCSIDQARGAYAAVLGKKLEAAQAENKKLTEDLGNLRTLGAEGLGVPPVSAGPGRETNGFLARVEAIQKQKMAEGKNAIQARAEAFADAQSQYPAEHHDWKIAEGQAHAERMAARSRARQTG